LAFFRFSSEAIYRMIQINHLSLTQIQEARVLIKDLSFIVNPGERIALIGEEGNGKSTLLKYLMGLPLPGFEAAGSKSLDQPVGYLEQDLRSAGAERMSSIISSWTRLRERLRTTPFWGKYRPS
jgi:ATPase subunit of ABC transporter with duplicated ATPase domains